MTLGALTNQGAYAATGSVTAPAAPVEAVIATAPATLGDTVDVLVGDARLRVGPCRWDPVSTRTALLFPTVGAACLTDVSNQGHNHVVWWDATAAAGEVAGATFGLLDAKGDLIAATADNTPARVPVGLDGQVLRASSTAAAGVVWASPNEGAVQAGVLAGTDCALTVDSTTQVTVVAGTSYVRNAAGILVRTTPISTILLGIPAASASNFRLDQAVEDSAGIVTRLAGTQGTTVTINNRTGAAAIPSGSQLLHDLLVTSGGVLVANVRDRRPNARGAWRRKLMATGGNLTTASTTQVAIDATNLAVRMECMGNPIRLTMHGLLSAPATGSIGFALLVDGAVTDGIGTTGLLAAGVPINQQSNPPTFTIPAPSIGSHLLQPSWLNSAGASNTIIVSTAIPFTMVLEEIVRGDFDNGTV